MQRYIAFLRGINLGRRRLPMSRLIDLFQGLGHSDVETFIASGNVLFSSNSRDSSRLEADIATHLESSLGYAVDTFVRTAAEVVAVGRARAFAEDGAEGITIHVGFLHRSLPRETATGLAAVRTNADEFHVKGREYYWLCRTRTSDSTVWSLPAMRALKLPTATMRNLSSIRKLIAKHLDTTAPRSRR